MRSMNSWIRRGARLVRRSQLSAALGLSGALGALRTLSLVGALGLMGALGSASPSFAADPVASACEAGLGTSAAQLIQTRYEGIRDIQADFTQENQSATFGGEPVMNTEPKSGKVRFAKPGKMHWSYLAPEKSIVVSDGSTLWIYDVDGKSVTRLKVTAGFLSGAALQFLLGDGKILETFEVTATSCSDAQVTLDLLPKEEATYERLGLIADRKTGDILGTSVLDLFGNLTTIRFSALKVNQSPLASVFELEIPEGVELIDYATEATEATEAR